MGELLWGNTCARPTPITQSRIECVALISCSQLDYLSAKEEPEPGEDELNREHESHDSVETFIGKLFRKLSDSNEATARAVMQLSEALKHMAQAGLRGNENALEAYANHAADLINHLEADDEGSEE